MKERVYVAPQIECIEIEIEDAVLGASGERPASPTLDNMNVLEEW